MADSRESYQIDEPTPEDLKTLFKKVSDAFLSSEKRTKHLILNITEVDDEGGEHATYILGGENITIGARMAQMVSTLMRENPLAAIMFFSELNEEMGKLKEALQQKPEQTDTKTTATSISELLDKISNQSKSRKH